MRIIVALWFILMLTMFWVVPTYGQTPQQAADILRNLDSPTNATDRQYIPRMLPRLRRIIITRKVTPAPAPVRRRLDGTRLDNPPMVYGFTPHDWQWWYQQEIHKEVSR